MSEKTQRAVFATRIGAVATTVGSAVGLGNIWRFPYEAGTHGGGAFMLFYILFIFILGVPVLCAEYMLGRGTRKNVFGAYRVTQPKGSQWHLAGVTGILASILILSFYSVVAGWTMEYFFESVSGSLTNNPTQDLHERFAEFSGGTWRPLMWTWIFLLTNFVVLLRGVTKGIEKVSNFLTPMLFVLLVIFCINSLTMSGAKEGLEFLFRPDFSKIDSRVLLAAMGQAFFSLSLGLGCMLTYGSYFSPRTRVVRTAVTTAGLDTLVAILSGVIIFPAVFTFGLSPSAGPTLVFEVLPSIFNNLAFGRVWSSLFFFLLILASLTSTISMSEISIAFFVEQLNMKRSVATIVNTSIAFVLGSLCALSFGPLSDFTIFGMTVFNLFDYVSSNILLPFGGLVVSFFVGWKINSKFIENELTNYGHDSCHVKGALTICLRYVAPIGISLIFLNTIGII